MSNYREDEERLAALREGNDDDWRRFYREQREPFRLYFLKYARMEPAEVSELYQEAMIILHRNVQRGKLAAPLQSSLKTYLFGIGKVLCRKRFADRKFDWTDEIPETGEAAEAETAAERRAKAELVRNLLDRIGEPCRQLLLLVYVRGFAMEAIAAQMDFPTEGAVRKRKYDCLRKLRAMV